MKYCYCNKLNKNIYRLVKIDNDNTFNFVEEFRDLNKFGGEASVTMIGIGKYQTYLHYIYTASFVGDNAATVEFYDLNGIKHKEPIAGDIVDTIKQFVLNHKCNS